MQATNSERPLLASSSTLRNTSPTKSVPSPLRRRLATAARTHRTRPTVSLVFPENLANSSVAERTAAENEVMRKKFEEYSSRYVRLQEPTRIEAEIRRCSTAKDIYSRYRELTLKIRSILASDEVSRIDSS